MKNITVAKNKIREGIYNLLQPYQFEMVDDRFLLIEDDLIKILEIQFLCNKDIQHIGGNTSCFFIRMGIFYNFIPLNYEVPKDHNTNLLIPSEPSCIIRKTLIKNFKQDYLRKELPTEARKRKDTWFVNEYDDIEILLDKFSKMIEKNVIGWFDKFSDVKYVYKFLKSANEGRCEKGREFGFGAKGSPARIRYIEAFREKCQPVKKCTMKFKRILPNEIKSNSGFSIRRSDRFWLEYKEDKKVMLIGVEPGIKDLAIYISSVKKWEPPFQNEVITDEDKEKIIKNVKDAFEFAKWNYIIE